jgi:hypothetical protein
VLANEARKIFRFIDTENKGEIKRDKILKMVCYLHDENKMQANQASIDPDDSEAGVNDELHPILNKLDRLARVTGPDAIITEDSFALYFCLCKDTYANMKDETPIVFESDQMVQQNLSDVNSLKV